MSAFAGIFNFYSRSIREAQREHLGTLWNCLEPSGPDGGDILFEGPLGMCYRALHTNSESRCEIQPLVGRGKTKVVGTLRLDNREDLIGNLRHALQRTDVEVPDIELALAAYETWGETFPKHLVGEFAIMLYDERQQTIMLVRDHIGARRLYYHYNDERMVCSSEIGPLLEIAGIPLEVNNEFVAGYLMYDPEPGLTAYKNIHAVKPFHTLKFTADRRVNEKRYWDLAQVKPLRYKTDAEYEEGFRFHFTNAVRGPLRTDRPVLCDLSGGLDSSSIVCVAHQLIQSGEVQAPDLFTVSLVSNDSPTSDQSKYIRYVEEHIGRSGYHIDENDSPLFSTLSVENALPSLNPLLFSEGKHRRISSLMQQANSRVLLSGSGGDEITCAQQNPTPELADLLVTFKFSALHERLKAWSKGLKQPYLSLLINTIGAVLPDAVRAKPELRQPGITPEFLMPKFMSDFSLKRRHVAYSPFECRTPSEMDQAKGFWSVLRGISAGYRSEMTAVDLSYPFLARPLVEYMQAVPHTQRVQLGKIRFLMRRALKDVLPAEITKRRGKGNPQEVLARAFMGEWPRLRPLLNDARICSYGYVHREAFLSAVENYALGKRIHLGMLLKLLALECWLRRLERSQPSASGVREQNARIYQQSPVRLGAIT